ncbi:MAG: DNA (cytosine-5-)-methyltransferase [Verrucomicrobiaceae bacterium]|nr:DNA (cytosine-5-)-methyltransferase [Verrucomicrobiaceae bacterium]
MKVVSLFSGIGGFEVGIKNSNLDAEVVFASEIDVHAKSSYIANFGKENLHGDITKISEKDIPDHDLLVAGFPCQAFSIAGKQMGFNDTRGTLFFDVARILKEKQPKYFLLENVKNLVSHNNGNTFKLIIKTLNELGYTIDFSIINSSEAGLPQNRERTYIVGILNGRNNKINSDKRNNKINKLKSSFEYKGFNFFNSLVFHAPQKYIKDILEETKNKKYLISNEDVENFIKTNCFNVNKTCVNKIVKLFDLPKNVWKDFERQRRVYSIYGISPTILARSDTTKVYISNSEAYIRKFTPRENFRLQGFEDSFIDNISNVVSMTQQYKQAGNAVSPPVITAIINHFIGFMEEIQI